MADVVSWGVGAGSFFDAIIMVLSTSIAVSAVWMDVAVVAVA